MSRDIGDTDSEGCSYEHGEVSGRGAPAGGAVGCRARGDPWCAPVVDLQAARPLQGWRGGRPGITIETPTVFADRARRPRSRNASSGCANRWASSASMPAETSRWHLETEGFTAPSTSTIWRVLTRRGFVTPEPHKRPKSSLIRFEAALPNEMWQSDMTHWSLADGSGVEIINFIDDHSRLCVASVVVAVATAVNTAEAFLAGLATSGKPPAFAAHRQRLHLHRQASQRPRMLETLLETQGVVYKHSRPYHPRTCGKVERFHQTLKKFLAKQEPSADLPALQGDIDRFVDYYNNQRPHRSLGRQTPAAVYAARLKAAARHTATRSPLPDPPRPSRQNRLRDPPLRIQAPPHRHRPRPSSAPASSSSSPTATSASSPSTANSSATYKSTRTATTSGSGRPAVSTMSRDICLRCPRRHKRTPGRIRTCVKGIRSPSPHPLGHGGVRSRLRRDPRFAATPLPYSARMAHHTKDKGDLGLAKAHADLVAQAFIVLFPMTEHAPFDLVAYKAGGFERVQVKYRSVKAGVVRVVFESSWSDAHGHHTRPIDKSQVDVICIYCPDTDECYYVRPAVHGVCVSLRVTATRNNQVVGVPPAEQFRLLATRPKA